MNFRTLTKYMLRRTDIGLLMFMLLLSTGGPAFAAPEDEYALKAAFVLNFAKFTQWPDNSFTDTPDAFSLCVVGGKSLEAGFRTIEGKGVGGRSLQIDFIPEAGGFDRCNMLFVGGNMDRTALLRIFASVKEKPVLTIGEMPDFAKLGGVINFVSKEGKLRFEVNRETSLKQKVNISSRLLKLAIIVNGNE